MPIQYSVIRFVPRPGRGESLNVGVVVVDPAENRALVELVHDTNRLRVISGKERVSLAFTFLKSWKEDVLRHQHGGSEIVFDANWLNQQGGENLLDFSSPTPVRSASLQDALAALVSDFLPRESPKLTRPSITRKNAISALRKAYSFYDLMRGTDFVEKPLIKSKNHSETMDFAVKNGVAVQIAQSWNFQQRDVDALSEAVKAWAWTIQDIREHGAKGFWSGDSFKVPDDVEVEALYIEPDTAEGGEALVEALHAFKQVGAQSAPVDGADKIAKRAVRALAAAH